MGLYNFLYCKTLVSAKGLDMYGSLKNGDRESVILANKHVAAALPFSGL